MPLIRENQLTALAVQRMKTPGLHLDGRGLYLVIGEGEGKSWIFRYIDPRTGKLRDMGLGAARDVPLAKARERAAECRAMRAEGIDPIDARRAKHAAEHEARAQAMTFGQAADALIASLASGWKNEKHRYQWGQTLGDAYCGTIRHKSVDKIDTDDVLRVLQPVWEAKPETAKRLRGRIEKVLDFAKVKRKRTGENPARWKGHLDHLLSKPKKLTRGHHAAMPFDQVPAFLAALRQREALAARALELIIFTACRAGEALGARWDEFDFEAGVWTIPASRMKLGREHRVPLAPCAVEMLQKLAEIKISDFVFPGNRPIKPLSGMSLEMLLRRAGAEDFTIHGFRSSFRDWAGDCTTFSRELAEAALAHRVGNDVELAYRRSDALEKRRALMIAWAHFLNTPPAAPGTQEPQELEAES